MLLAVLITFGLMQRSNEITAIKATGISIYRIIVPVLVSAAIVAAALFFFDQFYLPHANKRQDALRNQIKGKPAQTYLRPDRKWIFGQHSDIYYYQFFDSGPRSVRQLSRSFSSIRQLSRSRSGFTPSARTGPTTCSRWIFEQGWERDLQRIGDRELSQFDVATFPQLNEPPTYFKKEVKQSSEMNYEEFTPLHSRSAAERLRRRAAEGAAATRNLPSP